MSLRIIRASGQDEKLLDQVEALFVEMYQYMSEHGLILGLVEGGQTAWRQSIERTVGRFATLSLAVDDTDRVVAFAHCATAMLPTYLGGGRVGKINHVYVSPEVRSTGIGRRLVEDLESWLISQQIDSCELQVLCENPKAIEFWAGRGFTSELLQMRKLLPSQNDSLHEG